MNEPGFKFPKTLIGGFLGWLDSEATMVEPKRRLAECYDEDHNRVLE